MTRVEQSRKKQSLSRREAREIYLKFLFYTLVSCWKSDTFLEKIECKGNGKEKVMKKYKHTHKIYILIVYQNLKLFLVNLYWKTLETELKRF